MILSKKESKKQLTEVIPKKDNSVRLKEIEHELQMIQKKRVDVANYVNSLESVGHKAERFYRNVQSSTFNHEQRLKKERAELLKEDN